jgi:hypothetical protein
MKNLIFFTGAPGSRWSGVGQKIRDNWEDADNSDLTPDKLYTHHKYSGHKGNYYGPGMLNGNWLDKSFGTKAMWENEIKQSFNGVPNSIKTILSHNFAYYLDDIVKTFPDSKIVLCYRPDDECYKWWHQAGGWDISYPSYDWYRDNSTMNYQIAEQNKAILDFCYRKGLTLEQPGKNWFRQNFKRDIDFNMDKDVWVAVYG